MTDIFGLTDDKYLSDAQRGLAADLSRAFDNSRDVQERSMARYGLPALSSYEKDWAIERARTMADRTNRMRMARTNPATTAGGSGGGGRYPTTQSQQRNSIGGLLNFLPMLLGRDEYQRFQTQGAVRYIRDAFGNVTAVQSQPMYGNSPIDQNYIDNGFDQNYIDNGFDVGPYNSPIDQNYIDGGFEIDPNLFNFGG